MNDAQQQTSAVVDGNDSDVDSGDDVPMGLWGMWPQPALWGTAVVRARFVLCSVFCGLLVLYIAALASSESFPPSRWGAWANASERDTRPYFFWLKKAGSAQGRPKILPTYPWGVCRHPIQISALA